MATNINPKTRLNCRRGMLELDIILERFLNHAYAKTSAGEKQCFEQLLNMQDPKLYQLITGVTEAPTQFKTLLKKILVT